MAACAFGRTVFAFISRLMALLASGMENVLGVLHVFVGMIWVVAVYASQGGGIVQRTDCFRTQFLMFPVMVTCPASYADGEMGGVGEAGRFFTVNDQVFRWCGQAFGGRSRGQVAGREQGQGDCGGESDFFLQAWCTPLADFSGKPHDETSRFTFEFMLAVRRRKR